ncbi:MAG TPA: septum formation initiator family protein [Acidimicrobiia bacterium]
MTAHPLRKVGTEQGLRVLKGRRVRKPSIAPWMIMVLIAVVAFLGLGFARTSLDRSAFELAELNKAIDEQAALNEQLRLEVARLENPARIAPLADELGLVIPGDTNQLLVDLDVQSPVVAETDGDGANQ